MKNSVFQNFLRSSSILVFVLGFLTACDNSDTLDFEEPLAPVMTLSPDIEGDQVTFKGAISENFDRDEFSYGFMWYISDGNEVTEPTRIQVGVGDGPVEFSLNMLDLPVNKNLVVCAFAEGTEVFDSTFIGNEVDFEIPR